MYLFSQNDGIWELEDSSENEDPQSDVSVLPSVIQPALKPHAKTHFVFKGALDLKKKSHVLNWK